MEQALMNRIYNKLWDSREELEIDEIEMYYNLEQNLVIKYKYDNEFYLITNELLCV